MKNFDCDEIYIRIVEWSESFIVYKPKDIFIFNWNQIQILNWRKRSTEGTVLALLSNSWSKRMKLEMLLVCVHIMFHCFPQLLAFHCHHYPNQLHVDLTLGHFIWNNIQYFIFIRKKWNIWENNKKKSGSYSL